MEHVAMAVVGRFSCAASLSTLFLVSPPRLCSVLISRPRLFSAASDWRRHTESDEVRVGIRCARLATRVELQPREDMSVLIRDQEIGSCCYVCWVLLWPGLPSPRWAPAFGTSAAAPTRNGCELDVGWCTVGGRAAGDWRLWSFDAPQAPCQDGASGTGQKQGVQTQGQWREKTAVTVDEDEVIPARRRRRSRLSRLSRPSRP